MRVDRSAETRGHLKKMTAASWNRCVACEEWRALDSVIREALKLPPWEFPGVANEIEDRLLGETASAGEVAL